jgi:predicted DNA-binding protein
MSDSFGATVRANTIRLPEELWATLAHESERTGVSSAEMIRQAVVLYVAFLAAVRTANEDADLAGLLGAMLRQIGGEQA